MEPSLRTAWYQQGASPTTVAFDLDAYCLRIGYTGSRNALRSRRLKSCTRFAKGNYSEH